MSGRLSTKDFGLFLESETIKETKIVASKIFRGVVKRTPVSTGQTRASWRKTVDQVDRTTVDVGGSPESPLPPPANPNIRMDKPKKIFVTNRKSHIGYLEDGSPNTEASAMVAATLASL